MEKVILYTQNCPKCDILEKKLKDKNVEYEVFTDVEKMIEMGMSVMPVLEVDGVKMSFVEAMKYLEVKN